MIIIKKTIKIIIISILSVVLLLCGMIGYSIYDFISSTGLSLEDYKTIYAESKTEFDNDARAMLDIVQNSSKDIIIEGYGELLSIDSETKNYKITSNGFVISTGKKYIIEDKELKAIKNCNIKKYLRYFKFIYICKDYVSFEAKGLFDHKLIYCPSGNLEYMEYIEKINDNWYCCSDY